jgi:hypothetical protein
MRCPGAIRALSNLTFNKVKKKKKAKRPKWPIGI